MWPLGAPFGEIAQSPARFIKPRRLIRDLAGLDPVLGRFGPFEIRLATTKKEIRKAQRLRYEVFYEEGGAIANQASALVRRDICPFDAFCDHLLVIDMDRVNRFGRPKPKIVGTYRLLRRDVAERHHGFYSQREFDIAPLLARHANKRFLELGRSCVHPQYRSKRAIELLWRGLWRYAKHHRIDVLIGCASLPGVDPRALAVPLSFLHHHASAPQEWSVRPVRDRSIRMNILDEKAIDPRRGVAALPPLLKAYLRVGAKFGDGAVIDAQFGTVDVFTVMPLADIEERYISYYGGPMEMPERAVA
ncbi:GNAT family N-acetyltransferase [Methylocella tundrae]|uniref:L-ornithine N(alpha)-acyltransferase n=1 Tax=Methylocella tundrae TaxID=227605 RepID=A0A4V6IMY4_METTU|nr:GNAT family N-acyltransferase [Methylocella tundrae]WPP04118.1 GNAT family N-acyltransferase [Methylocella tundrae]VFU10376.1 Ornithine--acyl-ACP N-acyltransferase OlsB [Methylocella tundrae]